MATLRIAALGAAVVSLLASCILDFEPYDPRLAGSRGATGGRGGTSSSGGMGGTTSAGGMGGTTSAGGMGGTTSAGGMGGTTSAGGSGGSGPVVVSYGASVAECIFIAAPDPAVCAVDSATNAFVVDGQTGAMMTDVAHGYVRFDLDGQLAGRQITDVKLRLTASTMVGSDGPNSGEIWEVAAFTLQDLTGTVPAPVGSTAIAPSQGAVAVGQTVEWTLPPTIASANGSVYLGILPMVTNGVDYNNTAGLTPPELVVTGQ